MLHDSQFPPTAASAHLEKSTQGCIEGSPGTDFRGVGVGEVIVQNWRTQ